MLTAVLSSVGGHRPYHKALSTQRALPPTVLAKCPPLSKDKFKEKTPHTSLQLNKSMKQTFCLLNSKCWNCLLQPDVCWVISAHGLSLIRVHGSCPALSHLRMWDTCKC